MNHFSVKGMGLAMGVFWALANFMAGITAMHGWGGGYVEMMSSFYKGYAATFTGAFVGAVWAFFEGLIGGALFAYFYNRFAGA